MDYHCYDGDHIWGSKGDQIFQSDDLGATWREYLKVHASMVPHSKLYNRLTRSGIHNVIPVDRETIAVLVRKRFLVFRGKNLIVEVHIHNGSRPLRQGVLKKNDHIIYGEYWNNPERRPVSVYAFDPYTGDVQVLLSLKDKRHIHFVQQDECDQGMLLIGTGDEDNESGIYRYDLVTGALETIGCGSQDWRAVSLLQKDEYLYWGSDCPYKQNYIYRYCRHTGVAEKIQPISGPAYYSAISSQGRMFLATTIERRSEHRAVVYSSMDGNTWSEEGEWKKDIFPMLLFGFGTIELIHGQEALSDVFINLKGLK